jgi:hypothetical protein
VSHIELVKNRTYRCYCASTGNDVCWPYDNCGPDDVGNSDDGLWILLRLRVLSSRHMPKLVRPSRKKRTRLALFWFSKAACTVRAPGFGLAAPSRLAYLAFSLASTTQQGLGLASSRRFRLCGAVLGFAPVWGVDTRTRPRCPPAANACWICFWAVASCLRPLPLFASFLFFLRGGKRTTRTTIPPQVGPFRRKAMKPRLDLPLAAGSWFY